MMRIMLEHAADFEGWRAGARRAAEQGLGLEDISWVVGDAPRSLFDTMAAEPDVAERTNRAPKVRLRVPAAFLDLARQMISHRDSGRFDLAYKILLQLQREPGLLGNAADREVHRALGLAKAVRRDAHKMTAFVRFRKVGETADGVEQFVSWFEPDHYIVRHTAPFFKRRFHNMQWSILTPDECAHWDGARLTFEAGAGLERRPREDALEDYWRTYYRSIFNPARLKVKAMTAEMPKKYWRNLPEAQLIPELVGAAEGRSSDMIAAAASVPHAGRMARRAREAAVSVQAAGCGAGGSGREVPREFDSLEGMKRALCSCRSCPLWQPATQAVAGEGPPAARFMLVGEQPGDEEDLGGRPFIGPAGRLLDELLVEAGVRRAGCYVTNAVKHFKYEARGKRRLHKSPSAGEIDHCRWWLKKEIEFVRPRVIVGLGASAVRGITGRAMRLGEARGETVALDGGAQMVATYHPSYLLRLENVAERKRVRRQMVADLVSARGLAGVHGITFGG
jgi:probable DNA metabolism protein